MKTLQLLFTALMIVACNTPRGSETKEVHATGVLWNGRTVGPIQRPDLRTTIIQCEAADQYQSMKNGGVVEPAVWKAQGCKPLLVKTNNTTAFLTPEEYAALLKSVKKIAWSDCLQNQFWFCDGTKVDAEIEAAFSMTASKGKWISGTEWVDKISSHIVTGYAHSED